MRLSRTNAVWELFQANPSGIALWLLVGRLWRGITSAIMASFLRAPGLHLESGCRIIGARHISFGRGVFSNRNLWLEAVTSYRSQPFSPTITIGDYTSFSESVHISSIESIVIGRRVVMGSRIFISDHNHGVYKGDHQSRPDEAPADRLLGGGGPVTIGDNVWIGDNVIIVGPASVGSGTIIGANSLVRGVVPSNSMVAGTPARLVKVFNPLTGSWDKA